MQASPWHRFADFTINLQSGELRRGLEPVPLERQPALALMILVSSAGQLVTRTELQQAIWPGDTHVDFDRGLNYCLRQIRIALGDDAKAPRFVVTVPRQGYRFVAPVTTARAPAVAGSSRRAWKAALPVAAGLLATVALELGPGNEDHHRLAVSLARAIHDILF
jgi:DNA-binding winged helix-turn-helix (wHTH) protein